MNIAPFPKLGANLKMASPSSEDMVQKQRALLAHESDMMVCGCHIFEPDIKSRLIKGGCRDEELSWREFLISLGLELFPNQYIL